MTWEQRYRLRHSARTSLVLWSGLALVAALIAAPAVRWAERETGWVIFGFTPDGARAILGVLVGSMLTFFVFVLSATLIVVQLASGQSTPRVIGLVLATPGVKVALAVLTFTYTYTLAALARVDDRAPDLHVTIAVFLNLACVIVFLLFVQRLSTGLRPASLIRLVADRALQVFEQVYPLAFNAERIVSATNRSRVTTPTQVIDFSGQSGVVLAFTATELAQQAQIANVVVELVPQVGDFVGTGDPLFRIHGDLRPVAPDSLRGCVAVGAERTLDQDPRFVFRVLVDIASKALSPGINDPTTAVQALDQIQHLLHCVAKRHLDEGEIRGPDGQLRLVYGTPDWPDFVLLAVSEVRQFGAASLQVNRRLRAMLERLIEVVPEERRPPLQKELAVLGNAIARNFDDEEDRKRANVADCQGVGGSDSQTESRT
jgi:uncharacterized membrane protein